MAVTSEDNCVCCVCGQNFPFLDNLIEHFNSHKTEVRCHLCQAKFNSVMPLALHLKDAHRNQHLCKICGVLIKCTWHLNEHLEKHLQEVMEKPEVEKDMEPTELKPVVKTEKIKIKETISKNDLSRGLLMDHTYCASVHSIVPLRLNAIDHTYCGIRNCIDSYANTINKGSHFANIKTENERLPPDYLPECSQQSKANIVMLQPRSQRGEMSGSSITSNQDVKVENDNEDGFVECEPYKGEFEMTEDEESTETNNDEDSDSLPAGDTEYSHGEDISADMQYSAGIDNDESIKKRFHANHSMDTESITSTGKVGMQADSPISMVNTENCKSKPTFACCLCQVVCENENLLLKHTAEDHPSTIYICAHCLNIFSKEDAFRNHVCSRPTGYMSFLPATPVTLVPVLPLSDPTKQHSTNHSSQRLLPTPILGTNYNTVKIITSSKTFDKVSKTPLPNQCDPPLSLTTLKSTNAHSSLQISQFHNYTNTINQGLNLPKIKTVNETLPLDSLHESEANTSTLYPGTWRVEKSGLSIMSNQDVKVENDNEDGPVECGPYEEVVVKGEFEMTEGEESTESGTGEDSDSLLPGNTVCNPGEYLSSDSQNSIGPDSEESINKRSHANHRMNPESLTSTGKVGFQVDSSIFCNGKLVSTEKHTEDCKNMPTFACCFCQVICENEGVLLKHTAEYHPAVTLLCAYCLNIFSKEVTFRNHVCSRPTGQTSFLPATPLTPVPVVPLFDPAKPHSTNPSSQRLLPTPILGTKCNTIQMITLSKTFDKVSNTLLPNQCDPPLSLLTVKSTNAPSSLQISQFHNYTNTINQGLNLPKIKTENKRLPLDSLPESEANIFTHHPVTWRVEKSGSSIMSNQDVKVENNNEDGPVECGPYEEVVVKGEFAMTEGEESTKSGTGEDSDSLLPGNTVCNPGEDLSSDSQNSIGPDNEESIKKRSHANHRVNPESLTSTGKVGFQVDSSIFCNGKLVSTEKHTEDCKNMPTFACCLCQVICENEGVLLKHTTEYHPAATLLCAYCLKIFSKEDTFRNHVCSRPTSHTSILPATPVTPVPVVPLSDPAKPNSSNRSSQRLLPTPILGSNCNTVKMITLSKTFDKVSNTPLPNQCDPPLSLPTLKSTNAHSSLQISQFNNYTNTINQGLYLPKIKTENKRLSLDSLPESEANIFMQHPVTWRGEKSGSSIMSNQDVKVENENEDDLVECGPYEDVMVEWEFEMTEDEESTESGTGADSDSLPPGNTVYNTVKDLSSDSQYSTSPDNEESIKKRSHTNQSMNPESLTSTGKVGFQVDSSICCNGKLVSLGKHTEDCKNKPTFACCLCQVVCENEGLLLKHTAEYHPAATLLCAYCLNIFSKEDAFRNHVCSRPTGYMSFLPATPVTPVPFVPLSDAAKPHFTYRSIQRIRPTPILGSAPTQAKVVREISPLYPAKFTPHGVAVPRSLVRPPCPPGSSVFGPDVPVCSPSVVRPTNPSLSNQSKMILQIPTPSNPSLPTKGFVYFSPTVNFSAPIVVQANRNKLRLSPKQTPAANVRPLQLPAKPPVSCPTLVSGIGQNNQPQASTQTSPVQIPTSGPLEIVAMFLNKSKDLAQKKQLHQSWRSKTIFPCRHCGAISRQLSLRVRHRYLHQGSRLYICQCGKSFQRQLHLLRHQVQHAESVLFVCARCGNTFEGAHKLSWHKQRLHRKHKTSNGRQYAKKKCIAAFDCICGQVFSRPSALLWHMLKNAKPLKHKNDSGLNEPVSAV
ncbi:uncharacterized protein si:dkey-79d12.4 [Myxocyprinus asiaticus]|uniref:uncharacterized protein si:dkey-79d12.4 n=1 Tax=Myxocyprinus asiaticus TaxID=70543 RepID=UPI0022216FEC|nr:uncharacterized protein si:dkey-79d12.4 [Myxocyprinus asiaticus]XP_051576642.1 uncharacterized protein si:dkey-79d12.4 [Myxocyprinus asiaticus]